MSTLDAKLRSIQPAIKLSVIADIEFDDYYYRPIDYTIYKVNDKLSKPKLITPYRGKLIMQKADKQMVRLPADQVKRILMLMAEACNFIIKELSKTTIRGIASGDSKCFDALDEKIDELGALNIPTADKIELIHDMYVEFIAKKCRCLIRQAH